VNEVALTFDDGPSEWTEPILDLLAAHDARATFFVIGSRLAGHDDVVRRIVAEGHEVGNHTWSHPRLARDCDETQIADELERTSAAVEEITGSRVRLFRCPYYDFDKRVAEVAAALGLTHTPGTVTPPDWLPACRGGVIATLVLQLVHQGAIVGLHDGIPPDDPGPPTSRAATVESAALFLPRLRERRYRCLTASALLL
jgi:peptidoglycan/xylan/chitin deacetylase (PgdA/CDA1 family)